MSLDIAIAGDLSINRRVSVSQNDQFHELIQPLREATIGFAHLETILHDYEGPEVYPAAEAGGTWQRGPPYIADELEWMGLDAVSTPSNHVLDYSYGGLRSTWDALREVGIDFVGTGESLGEARSPTYIETEQGVVAVVSMTSSFTPWSRAGEMRSDMPGRPGVNPLEYHYAVDTGTLETMKELAETLGLWLTNPQDGEWIIHPPGLHNSTLKLVESDDDQVSTIPDERDLDGNVRAIRDANSRADIVLVHLHAHAWNPAGDLSEPADFITSVAHSCIDAGADLFVAQGSHSPLRGIELYDGQPILYDPGDFFRMSDTVTHFPADFYTRYDYNLDSDPRLATPSEGLQARQGSDPGITSGYNRAVNPAGGYHTGSVMGTVVCRCTFDSDELSRLELYPGTWDEPATVTEVGIPQLATGETAEKIIADVAALSESYDTDVQFEDGIGVVSLE